MIIICLVCIPVDMAHSKNCCFAEANADNKEDLSYFKNASGLELYLTVCPSWLSLSLATAIP